MFKYILFMLLSTGCAAQLTISEEDSNAKAEEIDNSWITWDTCSSKPGDHPCDFTLKDHNNEDWTLYNNYPTTMIIDFSTMWCGVCLNIAPHAQRLTDKYQNEGHDFLWVTILIENQYGQPPSQEDLKSWRDTYGMTTSPVLAGNRAMIDPTAEKGFPISSWPTLVIINKDMILKNGINGWNEAVITSWIDQEFDI